MRELGKLLSEQEQDELLREQQEQGQGQGNISWPQPLAEEALYGLTGDIVKTIEPHTEADPAALLISYFVMFGNIIGRTAYFAVEADRHYMNLFACLVGATAKGRKGVSFGQVKRLFESVDEKWAKENITQGLSSGEGLIWAVKDDIFKTIIDKKTGERKQILEEEGTTDKRLLVVEQEFARTIRVLSREGNPLSAVMRQAWDDGDLNIITKNNPAKATGAHISVIAHITKDELLRYLDSTEAGNGFGNRFLWVCVRRSKCLPEGGRLHEVDFTPLLKRLYKAVEFARTTGELRRDAEARELWAAVYPELSEGKPGLLGAMIARAEAQVMRLACIYALLDCSNIVRVEHLKAALAAWDYCERSARFIFGQSLGDPVADEILKALKMSGQVGITRTDISNYFGRNRGASQIGRALSLLSENGLVISRKELPEEGGKRPAERWFLNKQ